MARFGVFIIVALAAMGLGGQVDVVRLAIADHANATPWIAARGDFVAVAWGATATTGGADVYVAVSRDAGQSFDSPVRVNRDRGTARLGGELPPRVALHATSLKADPAITVVWGSKSAATQILAATSIDGGRSYPSPQVLSAPAAAGDRGWHGLTIDARGTPHVMWLDHRGLATRSKTAHDHHGDGADMAQFSGLFHSRTGTSPNEREVAKGVCYCCKLAIASGKDDTLYAAWRHVYKGNIRDIAFAMSRDGGRSFTDPVRVSPDNWQLAGCPDDGPAMAIGSDGTIHIVWPTVIDGESPQGALFHASTRDGRQFTARHRIPTLGAPKPSHPQVIVDDTGGLVVAWDEVIDGIRRASARSMRFNRAGAVEFGAIVAIGEGSTAYPVMALTRRGALAAWTHGTGASSVVTVGRVTGR